MSDLAELRRRYAEQGLTRATAAVAPMVQFAQWFEQATAAGLAEPNGFCLATTDGQPSQRTVLLKGHDAAGFVFYTNHTSRKAAQMRACQRVSMLFPWYALHRQLSVEGTIEVVSAATTRAYFATRPRSSQIGAWASRQSTAIASRQVLATRVAKITARYSHGEGHSEGHSEVEQEVPVPPFWGGYRIKPHRFEFWQGQSHRLHDRIVYTREEPPADGAWIITRLSP